MPHSLLRLLTSALVCLGLCVRATAGWAVAPQITHHDLEVSLDPDTHWLTASDTLTVVWDPSGGRPFNFLLSNALKVEDVRLAEGAALDWTVNPALKSRQQVTVLLPPSAQRQLRVRVAYRGALADEVKPATGLSFIRGDATQGTIDTEGIYLAGETGWTPAGPDDLATYRVGVTVPTGWSVCTQGKFLGETAVRGGVRSQWDAHVPSDSLALVGGRYHVERRTYGHLVVAAYLFPEHADAADMLLDAAARYIQRFSGLLGPYPFAEFAIVENFFSSGYGFPGFTLLGRGVVAQPERLLHPGYLDHEIAHNWWGNGVFVDQREGNWAEAFTTYYANYLAHEAEGSAAAVAYRRRAMQRFAIHAPLGTDYPLSLFESKTTKLDDAVGYTKGSMLLHLLRRAVGDEVFWPTMREVAQSHIGTRAAWSTFITALEHRSGEPLTEWTGQWLHRAGAPELRLEHVEARPEGPGYTVQGDLVQTGEEPYTLTLDVRVETAAGPVDTVLPVREARTRFTLPVHAIPLRLTVDPGANVFRRLATAEQPPCLNRTLYGGALLCVYPEDPRDPRNATYRELAEKAATDRGGVSVPVSELTSQLLADRSVLLFGHAEGHPLLRGLLAGVADTIQVDALGFTLRGERVEDAAGSVLASAARMDDPALTLTVYAGNSAAALGRATLLFYYGWDSGVRFAAGRPVGRFDAPPAADALAWDGVAAASDPPSVARIESDIAYLADPWLLGRLSGDPEIAEVQRALVGRFEGLGLAGVSGFRQEFALRDPQVLVPLPAGELSTRRETVPVPVWPVWWSAPEAFAGEVMFAGYGWAGREWDDYRRQQAHGRLVVVFGGGPPGMRRDEALAALAQQALAAQARGAGGLLVVVPAEDLLSYLPAIALPFADLPWPAARSPRGGDGAPPAQPSLALRAARVRSTGATPAEAVQIPVWVMPWNETTAPEVGPLELTRWQSRLAGGRPATVARVRGARLTLPKTWAPKPRAGVNVLGMLEGHDPQLANEVIVVGAHYDHLGLTETGQVFRGADDNASGVAAMLAAAEMLGARRDLLRRSVLFVAFDAEEWGLNGSRAFVAADPLAPRRVVAMLNADSVGRNIENQVYLVGGSTHPILGEPARRWAEAVGLTVGKDIDRFAYAHGSDHWPFAEAGIPALTLFASDYATMDTTADVPEALDVAHVARVGRLLGALTYELATRPPAASAAPVSPPPVEATAAEPADASAPTPVESAAAEPADAPVSAPVEAPAAEPAEAAAVAPADASVSAPAAAAAAEPPAESAPSPPAPKPRRRSRLFGR